MPPWTNRQSVAAFSPYIEDRFLGFKYGAGARIDAPVKTRAAEVVADLDLPVS
jgi:hypothetical protein